MSQGSWTAACVELDHPEPRFTHWYYYCVLPCTIARPASHLRVNTSQTSRRVILRLFVLHGSKPDGVSTARLRGVKIAFRSEIGASTNWSVDGTCGVCQSEPAQAEG